MYVHHDFCLVLTEHILEVRDGQNSDGFDRYPYEEVSNQSFSVIVEGEKQGTVCLECVSIVILYAITKSCWEEIFSVAITRSHL